MVNTQRADVQRLSIFLFTVPAERITNDQLVEMLGLQNFISPVVALGVIQNRNMHRDSVLNEQDREASTPDTLRLVSEVFSRPASEASHQLAIRFFNIRT